MPRAPAKKKTYTKKTVYNKSKARRSGFAGTTSKYKSDHQEKVCSCFVEKINDILAGDEAGLTVGNLANTGIVDVNQPIVIKACIALDARNTLLASSSHAAYKGLFNEWNTNAVYIDLLFSRELRENCDQIFLLTERGNRNIISSAGAMLSDVNCRMIQLGNNTQKLTFKHVFGTAQDKINKLSTENAVVPNDTMYLKILCVGKNQSGATLEAGDASVKLRVKMFNKYRDMKVIGDTPNESIPLN